MESVRCRWECQLGRCMNKRFGAQVRTHQKDVLAQLFVEFLSEENTQHH